MPDKRFKKLRRSDLIDMIFELQANEERLQKELSALREQMGVPDNPDVEIVPGDTPEVLELSMQAEKKESELSHVREDLARLREERRKQRRRSFFFRTLASTAAILIVVAAVAVLVATLFLPVLQVSGSSMEPTLADGDLILLHKDRNFKTGELIGLRYEGKVLLKRVIGGPGDYITIEEDGTVLVNGEALEEPYITEKSRGICDITFPYQVPENSWFVLGDHRAVSVDSRSSTVGCIRNEQIIGEVLLRFWPLDRLAWIRS